MKKTACNTFIKTGPEKVQKLAEDGKPMYNKAGEPLMTWPGHTVAFTMPVPEDDGEAQERYGCTLADLIEAGVTQLSYKGKYADACKGIETDPDACAAAIQAHADSIKFKAARSGGTAAKKVADTAKSVLPAEALASPEALRAFLEKVRNGEA